MIDLHSHILYGWDDGAKTLDDSLAMARLAAERGTRVIAATPHLFWQNQRVDPQWIRTATDELNEAIQTEGIPIQVVPGAEIPADWDNLTLIERGLAPRLGNSKAVLFEVPFVNLPVRFKDLVFHLQMEGFVPLLAHPERCQVYLANPDAFYRDVEADTPIQITAGSLTGGFGEKVFDFAWRLIMDERPIVIASDTHNIVKRRPGLRRAYDAVAQQFGEEAATLMCDGNPKALLDDRPPRIARIPREPRHAAAPARRGLLKRAFGR